MCACEPGHVCRVCRDLQDLHDSRDDYPEGERDWFPPHVETQEAQLP